MGRLLAGLALVGGLGVALDGAPAGGVAGSCPRGAAAVGARAVRGAKARWAVEQSGPPVQAALARIADDRVLLDALRAGNLGRSRAEAQRQLVRHVVRIRVVQRGRVVVDANARLFTVAGSSRQLRAGGRTVGLLSVSVQDVIGFVKLVHKYVPAEVVVRGPGGLLRTSLRPAPPGLPTAGCVRLGASRYAVGSFARSDFTGRPVRIWVLGRL